MDLSSFLSLRISSFDCSRYYQVTLGTTVLFFGHFYHRFSRDSALISSAKSAIAVRRSVCTSLALYRREYRRWTRLDTLKRLSALLSGFSDTFSADFREIPSL